MTTRGFTGRRGAKADEKRLPPGQYVTDDFGAARVGVRRAHDHSHLTRERPPPGWRGHARRIDAPMLAKVGFPRAAAPKVFICGPTPMVEDVAEALVGLGHESARVKTERFGASGGG